LETGLSSALAKDEWDKSRLHVSDISSCGRQTWYRIMYERHPEMFAMPKPGQDFKALLNFAVGHAYHEMIQKEFLIKRLGWCEPEDIEFRVKLPDGSLGGSVDAIIPTEKLDALCVQLGIPKVLAPGTHVVLDIKTKKDDTEVIRIPGRGKETKSTFHESLRKYFSMEYYTQVQIYMGLLDHYHKDRYPEVKAAIILYVNKNTGEFLPIGFRYDPEYFAGVLDKAEQLKVAIETESPPMREYTKSDGKCKGWMINGTLQYACPYFNLCHGQSKKEEF
jgi:hypothetical protein